MSISNVKKNRKSVKHSQSAYDRAITDARLKLSMARERVARLSEALTDLVAFKESGEPWPREGKEEYAESKVRSSK